MVKKLISLVILLSLQLGIFVKPTLALQTCKNSKIDWEPKIFFEGQSQYLLNFTSQDINTLDSLKNNGGPYVRLLVDQGIFSLGGMYTAPIKVEGSKFSIDLIISPLTKRSFHKGVLQHGPVENGSYSDFCSDVTYQIGSIDTCNLQSLPERIRENTQLTIKFIGKANTAYLLKIGNPNTLGAIVTIAKSPVTVGPVVDAARAALGIITTSSTATTADDGQGAFSSTLIPGVNGNPQRLVVYDPNNISGLCYKDITIDAQAPLPGPAPAGPVQPIPATPAVKECKPGDKDCSSGGGLPVEGCSIPDPKDPADRTKDHPGIATAIGCIHTSPTELVKDLMTFVIGIGGGLAFLLMLMGAFQMLTSAGNPDHLNAGRERLTNAVIGLLFVIFAVLFLQIVGVDILKIPGFGK